MPSPHRKLSELFGASNLRDYNILDIFCGVCSSAVRTARRSLIADVLFILIFILFTFQLNS